ncbi:hypothetical protein GH714_015958 [Hevea brasiliensis]|uniref:PsbP C-terminal domain-containing protein n=1 Tax=Hevea brasiliensis TaxID=3981 RepID=A0A6A6MZT0_HEVBR|nr:hypothetical protein GH714_015958 [Hevea brasiliensis]
MATILSPSARLSSSTTTQKPPQIPPPPKTQLPVPPHKPLLSTTLTAAIAATTILTTTAPSLADSAQTYHIYYGTAASAANYGGYGGNSDKKASAEYVYDVPDGWKERLVSKLKRARMELTASSTTQRRGLKKNSVKSEEKKDGDGQVYYVYEIDGIGKHSLIKVTCAKNKLYAHFVNAPTPEWNKDEETLRHLHESFKTVGSFQ